MHVKRGCVMQFKIQNPKLYEAMKLLVAAVSKLLNRGTRKRPLRDVGLLLLDYGKEIVQLPETKECARIMESEIQIRKEFASRISKDDEPVERPGVGSIYEFYLRPLLSRYFKDLGDLRLDQEVFGSLYVGFEEYLYSDSMSYIVLAPLAGFKSDADVIQLKKDLKIRRMDQEEIDRLWKPQEPYLPPIIDFVDTYVFKYTLEAPLSRRKRRIGLHVSLKPTLEEIFEGVVSALRLFKSGGVDFYFTQRIPIQWQPFGGISFGFKRRGGYLGLGEYHLGKDEIDEFVEFWKEIGEVIVGKQYRCHDYLTIVLKRLNLGSEERDLENKLIDFFVAFEALFLLEASELSYRLALRTATLLGDSYQERREITNFMRDAYVLRSQIVHGKTPKIKKKTIDLKEYVPRLENYLRHSIIKYFKIIRQFKDQTAILRYLDQEILK
jgi:hypothetical protein